MAMAGELKHAVVSTFDMFSIGLGPSSSHTVGPMRAAGKFVDLLRQKHIFNSTRHVRCDLFGSLACTGLGHNTDRAVMLGLEGLKPETCESETAFAREKAIRMKNILNFGGEFDIPFDPKRHLRWNFDEVLPFHSNGMTLFAFGESGEELIKQNFYSIGGGFVVADGIMEDVNAFQKMDSIGDEEEIKPSPPFPFCNGNQLIHFADAHDMKISEIVWENERTWYSDEEIRSKLLEIWHVMESCINRGINTRGMLPGNLDVQRRAPKMYNRISQAASNDPLRRYAPHNDDYMYCWSMAVNEENACGGRVVTAPTNGAAGIIPAVLKYYLTFCEGADEQGICDFLLTAAAIGMLYKQGASLSAAEMGCQGEVGVATSMAAAALCEVTGGGVYKVENAAEIGMEHSLGLTCDPIGGYVQIPCIERNAIGATKAVAAARLALYGEGRPRVKLDQVIKTMRQVGIDMHPRYKETSKGGLAVNVPVC